MLSIDPKEITTAKLHSYLLNAVAPRPIAFASTIDKNGAPNLSPFSFFNVFSANPPILIFSPARRVRNNTTKHTLENVIETMEVVINVVSYDIVHQMSLSSTEYPKSDNEFLKSGLTMLDSEMVKPYRVKESPVQFECKVNEVIALGDEGGAGNLIICEVLKMHISQTILDDNNDIDQIKLDLVSRAGGSFYSRAKSGFFEIPKPLASLGIGVDALPEAIRNSSILSGNDIGMLANVEALPTKEAVDDFVNIIRDKFSNLEQIDIKEKHKLAKSYLALGEVSNAWKVLLL